MSTLRSRLLSGALLAMSGVLGVTAAITLVLAHRYPADMRTIHFTALTVVAMAFLIVGLVMVRRGFASLDVLRARLADVRAGQARTLEGRYPEEVQPLVNDLNELLAHRDRAIERASARAGDLAHGLKTPLAVLQREAERAAARGDAALASTLDEEIDRMRRQIDYHLAQARTAASGRTVGVRCLVAESAGAVARALRRLHAERVTIDLDVGAADAVAVRREDLDEILGNLLDNACTWARSRVTLTSRDAAESIAIVIEDDGPGIRPELREAVFTRGVRGDSAPQGTGLGLAIVRELVRLYDGAIALGDAEIGGLRVTIRVRKGSEGS